MSNYGRYGGYGGYGRRHNSDDDEDDDNDNNDASGSSSPLSAKNGGGGGGKKSSSTTTTTTPAKVLKLNELLIRSLETAAEQGEGDEEPEVLPPPPMSVEQLQERAARLAIQAADEDEELDAFRRECDGDGDGVGVGVGEGDGDDVGGKAASSQKLPAAMMEEEERRVAALTFDPDALLPFQDMAERAKYIPLRLTYEERKSLRMVNAAVNVSDYTSQVDRQFRAKHPAAKRHHTQLQQIVAFMTGLVAGSDYAQGQQVLEDRNFEPHAESIKAKLEIARRYKITNPEKMRSEYGKLVYLMQDSVCAEIKPLLGVDINKPIATVYGLLQEKKGLALLEDPALGTATQEILADKGKSRSVIQLEIKRKEKAANELVRKYTNNKLKEEDIRACLYSISDNNSFLNSNRKPITDCIALLQKYFHPSLVAAAGGGGGGGGGGGDYSLAIEVGSAGARLSHSHVEQYNYVLQSLHLWGAIVEDTFRLWYLAECDLLSESTPYELKNTGQGLQRVQQSPRVYRAMHEILAHTQAKLGSWVGSSVIHLGDHNVPNTLVFIDKYTQVSRILGPLVKTLENIEAACEQDQGLMRYMDAYGGIEKAKKDILLDFFTHAFDGSGGDNFFDAGSCIDGRLTSAWQWCSQLSTKPYYPLFRLTGFLSFDGEFDK